jgi:hypothetical protein
VAFIISASVAPFLRWSRARTVAFLEPSRALAAFGAGLGTALPTVLWAFLAGEAGFALADDLVVFGLAASLAFVAGLRAAVAPVWVGLAVSAAPPSSP